MEGAPGRELSEGTMLDDKYRIERLLATGGMGSVYLGTHVRLRKRVAIKVLNPQLTSAPMVERFHREAITASQIGHEGIAQVTDLGTSTLGEPFLVMEYLEGESLASRLKASGALAIADACELGCAILSPLAAAHLAGIIHRDLKPDNVFLVRQSRGEMVKLLDFGISRTVDRDATFRLTTTGLVLGTPYYMSPEQARGDSEVTVAADLYAFGVILYEMLVGDIPIRAENYNQLMYRVMMGDFVWPRRRRSDLPEVLEQLIVRAMAQEPHDRPSSANEIEYALLPFCRPMFRDHASAGLSAPGLLYRSSGARPGGVGWSEPGSDHGMRVAATPLDPALASPASFANAGTQPGVASPASFASAGAQPGVAGIAGVDRPSARLPEASASSGAAPAAANTAPRRRPVARAAIAVALLAVGAAVVAITVGG
ncbi:MAG TPA: serine/threonine-protein kinase, partial [Kofleriaceae bacterium]|nr:serine/threonine-protein kinase [Kofleriaceae bacterium]